MPTYRVGNEPLQIRKSFRAVLCEQCGKSMGTIHVARIPKQLEGLSTRDLLKFYPFIKVDIGVHEKECPALKKEDGPLARDGSLKAHYRDFDGKTPITIVGTCTGAQSDDEAVPEYFVVFTAMCLSIARTWLGR